jgi:hypothetical protein
MEVVSKTSLPPLVQGAPLGSLRVELVAIALAAASARDSCPAARISWWGASDPEGDLVELTGRTVSLLFPVRARLQHLNRYLLDVGKLDIDIVDVRGADCSFVGRVQLDVGALAAGRPLAALLPVVAAGGAVVGSLSVSAQLAFMPTADDRGRAQPRLEQEAEQAASGGAGGEAAQRGGHSAASPPVAGPEAPLLLLSYQPEEYLEDTGSGSADVLDPLGAAHVGAGLAASPQRDGPAAATAAAPAAAAAEAAVCSQRLQEVILEGDGAQLACGIEVRVEAAFQLPAPDAPGGTCYCAYVAAVWQSDRRRRATTHVVTVHSVDPMGPTAVWNARLRLAAAPEEFSAGAAATGVDDDLDSHLASRGPFLLLNVWRRPPPPALPAAVAAAQLLRRDKAPAAPGPLDALAGCAAVDLSGLPAAGEVAGRYAVVDTRQRVQGSLKVAVTPSAALAQRFAQLAQPPGHLPGKDAGGSAAAGEGSGGGLEVPTPAAALLCASKLAPSAELEALQLGAVEPAAAATGRPPARACSAAARPPPRPPATRYAWSGSDSDDDAMGMLGVNFEGAVSGSEEEEPAP